MQLKSYSKIIIIIFIIVVIILLFFFIHGLVCTYGYVYLYDLLGVRSHDARLTYDRTLPYVYMGAIYLPI